jgi:hypothetical protein
MNFGLQQEDLRIAFPTKKKSNRTWIITPDGSDLAFDEVKVDNTLLKALLKANLWQRKLQNGAFANLAELCKRHKINDSYASKIMNLNYLSPQIKGMILDGKQPKYLKLQDLMADVPALWGEQEKRFLGLK